MNAKPFSAALLLAAMIGGVAAGQSASKAASAQNFAPGNQAGDHWVNSRGMVFVWCPPGAYTAGSPLNEPGRYADEEQHQVVIDEGFWIGKYEVTREQWMANIPRDAVASAKNHPLDMANYTKDAGRTLRALNEAEIKNGTLPSSWEYALPTEEQWEYAARAGTKTRFYFGDNITQLPKHANFGDRSFYDTRDVYSNAAHRTLSDGFAQLAPAGSFAPNPWGLHDVYCNLAEWCDNGASRGGSWVSCAENCRSAYRHKFGERESKPFIGFRFVIRKAKTEPTKN